MVSVQKGPRGNLKHDGKKRVGRFWLVAGLLPPFLNQYCTHGPALPCVLCVMHLTISASACGSLF